jgi:hypothetical protein
MGAAPFVFGNDVGGFDSDTRYKLDLCFATSASGTAGTVDATLFPYLAGFGGSDAAIGINAAIVANPNKLIYLPGTLFIDTPIVINTSNTGLIGDGEGLSFVLVRTANIDPLQIKPLSNAPGAYINNNSVKGITFATVVASTTGAIRYTQCNGFKMNNVKVSNIPEGFIQEGGQLSSITDCEVFASGAFFNLAATVNSAAISIREASMQGGTWQQPFTTVYDNIKISCTRAWENAICQSAGDGIKFVGMGYIAQAYKYNLKFAFLRNGASINAGRFDCYFDGVNNTITGSVFAIGAEADAFPLSVINDIDLGHSVINAGQNSGILWRKVETGRVNISDVTITNMPTWGWDFSAGPTCSLMANGTKVIGFSLTAGAGGCRVGNVASFNCVGSEFVNGSLGGSAINLFGTIASRTIAGNTISNTFADIADSSTTSKAAGGLNVSDNVSPTSSLQGIVQSNVTSSNPASFDFYLEGLSALTVSFSGQTVAPTFTTTPSIAWTRQGNRVTGDFAILFTSLGTAPGGSALQVTGLPYAMNSGVNSSICAIKANSVLATATDISAETVAGATTLLIAKQSAGAIVGLTNNDLTATSTLKGTISYQVPT